MRVKVLQDSKFADMPGVLRIKNDVIDLPDGVARRAIAAGRAETTSSQLKQSRRKTEEAAPAESPATPAEPSGRRGLFGRREDKDEPPARTEAEHKDK